MGIIGNSTPNTVRITPDGMLMVCLCDVDGANLMDGPLLTDAEMCSDHASLKLESLVNVGVQCLLHYMDERGEIVPLRQREV